MVDLSEKLRALSAQMSKMEQPATQDALDYALKEEQLTGQKQDREQRKTFAMWIFFMVCAFLFWVMSLVSFCAFGCAHLETSVFNTLLGTTTALVIAIFNFVARYLFRNK